MPVSSSQGDEHDTLGGARPLADEDDAGGLEPAPVASFHRLGAGHDVPASQIRAEEGDRVVAQAQADMAVILDDLATGGHRPERADGLVHLWHELGFAG